MKIIKTDQGQFIKVDNSIILWVNNGWKVIFGWRWNKNEQAWGKHCVEFTFRNYEIVTEADLPKRLPEVEV